MIICPNCRAKLGDGSTKCVVCGASLGVGTSAPKAPEPAQPAVAPSAPAVAAAPVVEAPKPQADNALKPTGDTSNPKTELIEDKKPATAQVPPQAPPPPDHPMYQQYQYPPGYYPQQTATNWQTHPYEAGQPNQCPRCHNLNVVTYYDNGTGVCGACYYKFYWRAAKDPLSSVGREFDKLFG
jgi:ribosomal protein L37AE/L43A